MNLSELRVRAKLYIPAAKTSVFTNTVLDSLLNDAARDVAFNIGLYEKNKLFDIVAEKQEYSLTTEVSNNDYLRINKPGVKWYDGTGWDDLDQVTIAYLDEEYPNWRDDTSGDPQRYAIEKDTLIFHPKPDTSGTGYGRIYYFAAPPKMTSDTHYPFPIESSQETPISQFRVLNEAILKYVYWKSNNPLSKEEQRDPAETEYYRELQAKASLLGKRVDIRQNVETRYQGHKFIR